MNRSYNNALVLLRFLAFVILALGFLGLLFVAVSLALSVLDAPTEIINSVWPAALQSMVTAPLWLLLGWVLLAISPRIAKRISRPCVDEAP